MSTLLASFEDQSQQVHIELWEENHPVKPHHHDDAVTPERKEAVVIGGGARCWFEGPSTPWGSLLTASYPRTGLDAWLASSKDHSHSEPHGLTVWCLSLSIDGMTSGDLNDGTNIIVRRAESAKTNHPKISVSLSDEERENYVLISGGAHVKWSSNEPGNLLTASYPSSSHTWTARSKDHGIPSPAVLESYLVALRHELPIRSQQKYVLVDFESEESYPAKNHPTQTTKMLPDFALTGGGAVAHWGSNGNMLWRLEPGADSFTAASKDHDLPDPCTITTYSVGIRLV
ncbi:hypothetical protein ACFW6V_28485 [Streptomyces sp. NPDC058734]|uniref:hypothetical protein n=1 Tax=Streptomyces sp. NPDC058734 TaxID=3346615 RepID=UPI0036C35C20